MPTAKRLHENGHAAKFDLRCDDWDMVVCDGPVLATAIHDGHAMRDALLSRCALDDAVRRREEDPFTGVLTSVGDTRIRMHTSRFEVDVNRPREQALYLEPDDAWGLQPWRHPPSASERAQSLAIHDRFYALVAAWIDATLADWGCALVLDIHSYNHRRGGPAAPPADQAGNPDIELGVTTLDQDRWGDVSRRFADALRAQPMAGRQLDVRENVRFPTGGHFPEWIHATWGEQVCTISPEYKKIFMDEWTGSVDIAAIEDLRRGLQDAVAAVRTAFVA